MIIECEKCKSKFDLDESLIKPDGSKVRCSGCKTVFVAYPPVPKTADESGEVLSEDLQETVALDSPPVLEKEEEESKETEEADFDKAFEDAMEDDEVEAVSLDDIPDEGDETVDMDEALGRAAKIEEDITKEDTEKKVSTEVAEEAAPEAPAPKKKKDGRFRGLLVIILVILFLLIGGGVAVVMWAPGLLPDVLSFLKPTDKSEITDVGVRKLIFKSGSVNGSFTESKKLGQLFIIKGLIVNNYSKPRSYILIKGAILNEKGAVIKRKMVYAGNTFTENQLNEATLEEINKKSKNRLGMGGVNRNIKPGGTVPFMIIFHNLPEDLSEFTVEAVSSSSGT